MHIAAQHGYVAVLERLLARHAGESILVIGTYLEQLEWVARRYPRERKRLFRELKSAPPRQLLALPFRADASQRQPKGAPIWGRAGTHACQRGTHGRR